MKTIEPYSIYKRLTGLKNHSVDISFKSQNIYQKSLKTKIINYIWKNLFIPDPKIGWILFSIFKAIYIIKKEKISLIYSTSPPYTTSLIALLTKFFTKTIWICDFRDIWTNNSLQPQRRLVAKWIDKIMLLLN